LNAVLFGNRVVRLFHCYSETSCSYTI